MTDLEEIENIYEYLYYYLAESERKDLYRLYDLAAQNLAARELIKEQIEMIQEADKSNYLNGQLVMALKIKRILTDE